MWRQSSGKDLECASLADAAKLRLVTWAPAFVAIRPGSGITSQSANMQPDSPSLMPAGLESGLSRAESLIADADLPEADDISDA